jgi:hypothetical protein
LHGIDPADPLRRVVELFDGGKNARSPKRWSSASTRVERCLKRGQRRPERSPVLHTGVQV